MELLRLRQIKAAVEVYKADLERRASTGDTSSPEPSPAPAIILKYFERYGPRLFGHPARLGADGRVLAVVHRTNNVLEQFFGDEKRCLRRRIGRANLGLDLEQQPAQAALAANLRSERYVRVLCGSLAHLPAAFAALDAGAHVGAATLDREPRHAELRRRLGQLLAGGTIAAPAPTRCPDQRAAPTLLAADASEAWPELQQLPGDEANALCDDVFPAVLDKPAKPRDPRLPPPGSTLNRRFGGRNHRVTVAQEGFDYRGRHYASLSTIATEISGNAGSGYVFFRLSKPWAEGGAEAVQIRRQRARYRRARAAATGS